MRYLWICVFAISSLLEAKKTPSTLFSPIDPLSLTQNMAFYELYPDTPEGEIAKERVWNILQISPIPLTSLPSFNLQALVSLISKQPFDPIEELSKEDLDALACLANNLPHKQLAGSQIWTWEELLATPDAEIDIGRGLLVAQFTQDPDCQRKIRQHEATLDVMALQIQARLPRPASAEEKILAINDFLFREMGFRYPPKTVDIKNIDLYSLLPSVLESRLGVCMGVSLLYLSLAQRLDLPLEIITPPGHIYVRYVQDGKVRNIETTAQGMDIPSERYLGMNTKKLLLCTYKGALANALVNQAGPFLRQGKYLEAFALYQKAHQLYPESKNTQRLLGLTAACLGNKKESRKYLSPLKNKLPPDHISSDYLVEDYLEGKISAKGISALLSCDSSTPHSVSKQKAHIEEILHSYPSFRAGLLYLAELQYDQQEWEQSIQTLLRYYALDKTHIEVLFSLAQLYLQVSDYPHAWDFLEQAKKIAAGAHHHPTALQELERMLVPLCPKPKNNIIH